MADFAFLQNKTSKKWNILAPRRAKRTNENGVQATVCPFCPGRESDEEELYRVGGEAKDPNWSVRVIPNKFPFTQHHELIIHSPDHHKNIDELPAAHLTLLFQTYRKRFRLQQKHGQVVLFHNRGHAAGESLPHPHTQLAVVPFEIDITSREERVWQSHGILSIAQGLLRRNNNAPRNDEKNIVETDCFKIFCPETSEWPDEVWIAPKEEENFFGSISNKEIEDLVFILPRLIQLFDLRHGHEFPFNFYIAPEREWYIRLIPRAKILGGFELATGIMVNTQDPAETFSFLKEHFWNPDREKIKESHQAEYGRKA